MIERQFLNETEDVILERMKERVDDSIDKRQGSVTHDMLSPAAFELAQAYVALDDVIAYGLNVTEDSPDEFVDLKVEWNTTRKEAIKSIGQLTFTGENGTIIPIGTQARTEETNPVYFQTLEEGTIVDGKAILRAEALEGGVKGNVDTGLIVVSLGNLTGVTAVTNTSSFIGGVDRESNSSLLERYYEKVRKPATSGNVYHYEQWAKSIPGVGDARVTPVWNGPGTVRVVLLDDQKKSPNEMIINSTINYIESVKPVGADVTITGATELPINVSATLILETGANLETVKEHFKQGLQSYLETIAFARNEITGQAEQIRYSRIANVLLDVPWIVDYSNLLVNGGTANILPGNEEVGVLGSVTFT